MKMKKQKELLYLNMVKGFAFSELRLLKCLHILTNISESILLLKIKKRKNITIYNNKNRHNNK